MYSFDNWTGEGGGADDPAREPVKDPVATAPGSDMSQPFFAITPTAIREKRVNEAKP